MSSGDPPGSDLRNTRSSPPESLAGTSKETPAGKGAKRQELSLMERIQVIKSREEGKSMRQLAAEFGCGKTQILNILAQKDRYLRDWDESEAASNPRQSARKRRPRRTGNEETNRLVWQWYQDQRNKGVHVTGPTIQKQAKGIAENLGITNFAASNGWLDSFRKLHNMGPSKGFNQNNPVFNAIPHTVAACVTTINSLLAGLGVTTDKSNLSLIEPYAEPDLFIQASSSSSNSYTPTTIGGASSGMQDYDLYHSFYDPLATENAVGPNFYQQQGVSSLNPADLAPNTSAATSANVSGPNYGILRSLSSSNPGMQDPGLHYTITTGYDSNSAPEYNHFANLAAAFQSQGYLDEGPVVTDGLVADRGGNFTLGIDQPCNNTCVHLIGCGVPGQCPHSKNCLNYKAESDENEGSDSPREERSRVELLQEQERGAMDPPLGSMEIEVPGSASWPRRVEELHPVSSSDSLGSSLKESSESSSAQVPGQSQHGFLGENVYTDRPISPDPYGLRGQRFFPHSSSARKRRRQRGEGAAVDTTSGAESFQESTESDMPRSNTTTSSANSVEAGPSYRQVIVSNATRIPPCFAEMVRRVQEEGLIYLAFKDDLDQDWLEVRAAQAVYRVPMHGYKTHLARLIVNDVLHYWLEVVGDCVAEGDLVTPAVSLNLSLIRGILRSLKGGYVPCEGKFGIMEKLNGRLLPRLVAQCALENNAYHTTPDHRFRSYDCGKWIDVREGPRCYNCRTEVEGGEGAATRFTIEEPEDEDQNTFDDTQGPEQHPEEASQHRQKHLSPPSGSQKSPCNSNSEPLDLSRSVLTGSKSVAGARYEYPPGGVLRYSHQLAELQREPMEDILLAEEDPEEWVQQQIRRYSYPDGQQLSMTDERGGVTLLTDGIANQGLTPKEEQELETDFEAIHIKPEFPC